MTLTIVVATDLKAVEMLLEEEEKDTSHNRLVLVEIRIKKPSILGSFIITFF